MGTDLYTIRILEKCYVISKIYVDFIDKSIDVHPQVRVFNIHLFDWCTICNRVWKLFAFRLK